MTFTEAMNAECQHCGEKAQMHRMTKAGNLYCLEVTSWKANSGRWGGMDTRLWAITRAKCNDLYKSPLPQAVGKAISAGLTSFA